MNVLSQSQADEIRTLLNDTPEDQNKVIYDGKTMPRAEAMKLADAVQVHAQGTAYFDPADTADEFVSPLFKARVWSSMAWSADMACINAARDLFYSIREMREDTIDDFNDFINEIAEVKASEDFAEGLGYEENAGKLTQLSQLIGLREIWHDRADTTASDAGTRHAPKTLEELMDAEKKRTVDSHISANIELRASFAADGDPVLEKTMIEQLTKKQNALFDEQHKNRRKLAPAVRNLVRIADYRRTKDAVQFHYLADEVQLRLINGTRSAISRAMDDLASLRGVTTEDYTLILREGYAAIKHLDQIIASPKFSR